jgi:hypothetical protein
MKKREINILRRIADIKNQKFLNDIATSLNDKILTIKGMY